MTREYLFVPFVEDRYLPIMVEGPGGAAPSAVETGLAAVRPWRTWAGGAGAARWAGGEDVASV